MLALPLETERLSLREFTSDDLADMHAYASSEDATRYLFWGPNTLEETRVRLASFIAAQSEQPRLVYELALAERGKASSIGALCLYLDEGERTAELGFVVHPDFWGRGFAPEAAKTLVAAGFSCLKLEGIWATCDTRNLASTAVLEQIGMKRVETLKECRETEDGRVDEHRYVLSRPGSS